jgi:hypothetical protein
VSPSAPDAVALAELRMSSRIDDFAKLYEIYQSGKMRRYNLLFAVNGGAFAILELATAGDNPAASAVAEAATPTAVDVLLARLPWGLAIFSLVMFVDIWRFGQWMRATLRAQSEKASAPLGEAFTPVGKAILLVIASLLITGWLLLALDRPQWTWLPPTLFAAWFLLLLTLANLSECERVEKLFADIYIRLPQLCRKAR